MRALVSGSMAFDYIMHFPGRFADYLDAAGGKVGATFTTPTMRRAWGGCAGNIAYGLAKLGDDPLLLATVGGDFAPYRARLREFGIPDDGVREYAESFTAQAYIVTDDDNNQITLFHPGAMNNAHEQDAGATAKAKGANIAIVSPNGREGMLAHAEQLSTLGIPLVVDPGQAVGLFTGDELRKLLGFATCAIFNRHEFATAAKAAGFNEDEASGMVNALIVTDGERGARAWINNGEKNAGTKSAGTECKVLESDAVVLGETRDPTGCGDAFRAAMLHGLARGWNWRDTLDFSALVAGVKAQSNGGQEYDLSPEQARSEFTKRFGRELPSS